MADDSLALLKSAGVENAEKFAPLLEEDRKKSLLAADHRFQPSSGSSSAPKSVVFVCGQNAGRSQLAEALFKKRLEELHVPADRAVSFSAGSVPGKALNPVVRDALKEVDVDTSTLFPKPLTREVAGAASLIVTMGCDTTTPLFEGKKTLHWELPDAKGKDLAGIREIRESVSKLVDDLIENLGIVDGEKKL